MNYVSDNCERLQDIAINSLGRFKDKRVHDLATKLVVEGNLDAGLPLLTENWQKADEKLIRKQVLQTKKSISCHTTGFARYLHKALFQFMW